MIRVFLADDHPVVRLGVRALLSTEDDLEVVGEAGDGREAVRLASLADWAVDVLVLDVSLPKLNGMEVLTQVRVLHPTMPVLMLSMYAESQYARHLLSLGASGYVSKDRSEEELVAAIRAVHRGETFVSRVLDDELVALTPRQLQILGLLAEGKSVSAMAKELGLSISTVSTHLGLARERLGARSSAELVALAERRGVL
jgi:DNA-binding NarL/FixJ family response regulator